MSTYPSARAPSWRAGKTQPEYMRRIAAERRAARERFLAQVSDAVTRLGIAYVVEVAEELRTAKLGRVGSALSILERRGVLVSEKRRGPFRDARHGSGNGRRYFRRAKETNAPR